MARTPMSSSVEELQEVVAQLETTVDEQAALISFYREWKRLIDSQQFGSTSERFSDAQGQLFNEAEHEAASSEAVEPDEVSVPAHTRKKSGRRPLPDFLPLHEVLHDPADHEKVCPPARAHPLVETRPHPSLPKLSTGTAG